MADLRNLDFEGKKVLVRVDFNVPLNDAFEITDDTRMLKAKPTLEYILQEGGALIIMTHMGRPKLDDPSSLERLSTKHLVHHLMELLEVQVKHIPSCMSNDVLPVLADLQPGEIALLENTRFYPEEKKGDEAFAEMLSKYGDVYINDAFGTAHRAHASTAVVAKFFDSTAKAFGLLMQNEIQNASKLMQEAEKPVTAIVGGAKVSDKIQLIENLMDFADNILIGGGMSYTFIKAQNGQIGNSLCEDEHMDLALTILEKAEATNTKVYLPIDSLIADKFDAKAKTQVVNSSEIPDGWMGLDIGPEAQKQYGEIILNSKSILWNGPVGVFELEPFSNGTLAMASYIAEATDEGAYSLIGGGDSVAAINQSGLADKVSFISTGGGAMLELLEGKTLPGVASII